MIFVTVGTQKFQMNRIIEAVDRLAERGRLPDTVFVQTGHSTYQPQYCDWSPFIEKDEATKKTNECSVLICHGGVGSILMGLKARKKVLVVPRKKEFGEHVDDHQVEIAEAFMKKGYVKMVDSVSDLDTILCSCQNWCPEVFQTNQDHFQQILLSLIEK